MRTHRPPVEALSSHQEYRVAPTVCSLHAVHVRLKRFCSVIGIDFSMSGNKMLVWRRHERTTDRWREAKYCFRLNNNDNDNRSDRIQGKGPHFFFAVGVDMRVLCSVDPNNKIIIEIEIGWPFRYDLASPQIFLFCFGEQKSSVIALRTQRIYF